MLPVQSGFPKLLQISDDDSSLAVQIMLQFQGGPVAAPLIIPPGGFGNFTPGGVSTDIDFSLLQPAKLKVPKSFTATIYWERVPGGGTDPGLFGFYGGVDTTIFIASRYGTLKDALNFETIRGPITMIGKKITVFKMADDDGTMTGIIQLTLFEKEFQTMVL